MQILQTFRLIADTGKILTNGTQQGYVIDLAPGQSPDSWQEIDDAKNDDNGEG